MKPFKVRRTIMEAVPAARDDLTQIRDDIHTAVTVFTVCAVVVSIAIILSTLREP